MLKTESRMFIFSCIYGNMTSVVIHRLFYAFKGEYSVFVSDINFYTPGIRSMQWGYIVFVFSVCQCVSLSVNIYFVSKISQELLYLETWNFVHMTSMTSCIVGKNIRAMGPGPLELFPFVVLAILMAMAGGISEHMLTSWSS